MKKKSKNKKKNEKQHAKSEKLKKPKKRKEELKMVKWRTKGGEIKEMKRTYVPGFQTFKHLKNIYE
jgi:hypothetical protein